MWNTSIVAVIEPSTGPPASFRQWLCRTSTFSFFTLTAAGVVQIYECHTRRGTQPVGSDYSLTAAFEAVQSTARVWPWNSAATADTSCTEPAM